MWRWFRREYRPNQMRKWLKHWTRKNAVLALIALAVVAMLTRLFYLESYLASSEFIQGTKGPVIPCKSAVYRRIHYIQRPHYISSDIFQGCQYSCYFTDSETLDDETDNLIVLWRDLPEFPPPKPHNQIWVFHSMEPPPIHPRSYSAWRGLFNWTISYRRDSDIFSPYGVIEKREKSTGDAILQEFDLNWGKKEKDIVWFVSNCKRSHSMRNEYAAELNKTIGVDIFGQCGDLKCDEKWPICARKLQSIYRYYLSFENSLCRDYITEKSFKIFESLFDAIPIVRGGANLDHYLPPGSYLSTKEFSSIEYLGNFLKLMANTKRTPSTFFNWRKHFVAKDTIDSNETFCELCRRGHTDNKYKRLYDDFQTWFSGGEDNPFCLSITTVE